MGKYTQCVHVHIFMGKNPENLDVYKPCLKVLKNIKQVYFYASSAKYGIH